jgi:hypothetical protein
VPMGALQAGLLVRTGSESVVRRGRALGRDGSVSWGAQIFADQRRWNADEPLELAPRTEAVPYTPKVIAFWERPREASR